MNTKLLKGAMGNMDGDYITLSNQWATVTIALQTGHGHVWVVTGDILDIRGRDRTFPTLSRAMTYAVESLKAYRDGSPNK